MPDGHIDVDHPERYRTRSGCRVIDLELDEGAARQGASYPVDAIVRINGEKVRIPYRLDGRLGRDCAESPDDLDLIRIPEAEEIDALQATVARLAAALDDAHARIAQLESR